VLSVDQSSNQQGSGASVVLEEPNGFLIEQALRFAYKASNNQAKYKTLIAGMLLAKEMGARSLYGTGNWGVPSQGSTDGCVPELCSNSEGGVRGVRASAHPKGGRQRTVIHETLKTPRTFVANNRVNVLQIRTSKGRARSHRSLTQGTSKTPSVSIYPISPRGKDPMQVCALEEGDTWMTPYSRYLADGMLPVEPEEGKKIKTNSVRYTLVDGALFKHGFTHPILTCVSGDECTRIMTELHEGIRGRHVGRRSLASKVVREGFYWPTVSEDCVKHDQCCKQC